jgi:hypothetical protein
MCLTIGIPSRAAAQGNLYGVAADTNAYAKFTAAARTYTYSFVNDDGSPITGGSGTLAYGAAIPKPAADPVKSGDAQYSYAFAGYAGYTDGMTISAT